MLVIFKLLILCQKLPAHLLVSFPTRQYTEEPNISLNSLNIFLFLIKQAMNLSISTKDASLLFYVIKGEHNKYYIFGL